MNLKKIECNLIKNKIGACGNRSESTYYVRNLRDLSTVHITHPARSTTLPVVRSILPLWGNEATRRVERGKTFPFDVTHTRLPRIYVMLLLQVATGKAWAPGRAIDISRGRRSPTNHAKNHAKTPKRRHKDWTRKEKETYHAENAYYPPKNYLVDKITVELRELDFFIFRYFFLIPAEGLIFRVLKIFDKSNSDNSNKLFLTIRLVTLDGWGAKCLNSKILGLLMSQI